MDKNHLNIVVLIDCKNNDYYKEFPTDVLDSITFYGSENNISINVKTYDLGSNMASHILFNEVKQLNPNIVITFDLAGFDMLTSGDTLALNGLSCFTYNVLLYSEDYYKGKLRLRQNLSMFTIIPDKEDIDMWQKKYLSIPNIVSYKGLNRKASSVSERDNNKTVMKDLWRHMEALCYMRTEI